MSEQSVSLYSSKDLQNGGDTGAHRQLNAHPSAQQQRLATRKNEREAAVVVPLLRSGSGILVHPLRVYLRRLEVSSGVSLEQTRMYAVPT